MAKDDLLKDLFEGKLLDADLFGLLGCDALPNGDSIHVAVCFWRRDLESAFILKWREE
jgi:hypothetical protein